MKIAAAACIAATAAAWDPEFMRGAQTGFFLTSEEQFEDYSCPTPEINGQMKTYIDMAMPMKMMFQNMNPEADHPMMDMLFDGALSFARISSVFSEEYDGGAFCQGLLFSKDASKMVWAVGGRIMKRMTHQEETPVENKKLALESKFN